MMQRILKGNVVCGYRIRKDFVITTGSFLCQA